MGTYVASGTCDGKILYKCEDCSTASEEYLYYTSSSDDWSIGREGCGSLAVGMYTVGSNSGDLGLASGLSTILAPMGWSRRQRSLYVALALMSVRTI